MATFDELIEYPFLCGNLMSEEDVRLETRGSWSAVNGTVSVDVDNFIFSGYNSLRIVPASNDDVSVTFEQTRSTIPQGGDNFIFHARCRSSRDILATIKMERTPSVSDVVEETVTNQMVAASDRWNIIRSSPIEIPTTPQLFTVKTTVTFSGHLGFPILLHFPVVQREYGLTQNSFLREVITLMPRVFVDADSGKTDPSVPMSRFMELGLAYANLGFEQQRNFFYRDTSLGFDENDPETKSKLVNAEVAPRDYLAWLSQFVGAPIFDPVIRSTPWGNLPQTWADLMSDIDPDSETPLTISSIVRSSGQVSAVVVESVDDLEEGEVVVVSGSTDFDGEFIIESVNSGSLTISWSDDRVDASGTSGSIKVYDTQWLELEKFNTDVTTLIDYIRWQVSTGYYGINAGTRDAVTESVRQVLRGGRTVNLQYHHGGDPWTVKIFTRTSETRDGVEGQSNTQVLNAIAKAKPAGFKFLHECNEIAGDWIFVLGDPENGVLGESRL